MAPECDLSVLEAEDFVAGVTGLASPDVKVDGWTDWTVTPYWSDGARTAARDGKDQSAPNDHREASH